MFVRDGLPYSPRTSGQTTSAVFSLPLRFLASDKAFFLWECLHFPPFSVRKIPVRYSFFRYIPLLIQVILTNLAERYET